MLKYLNGINSRIFSDDIAIPSVLESRHLPGLDGLRGVAITLVILSHVFLNSEYSKNFSGDSGVEIFFVISGFLITTLLLKEKVKTGAVSLKLFYLRRFLRILPVAYLFLLVLALLNYILFLDISWHSFFSASLFFQNIPKLSTYNWFVAHFWSLSVEQQFYFTFPILLVLNFTKFIRLAILIVIVIPIIGVLTYSKTGFFLTNTVVHTISLVLINLLGKMVCILIGSLTSILLFKGFFQYKLNPFTRYLSLILFTLALLIHTEASALMIPYCGLFLFPLLIAIVIVLNLDNASVLGKFLNNKILSYIGVLSYSLYIWQQLFTSSSNKLIRGTSTLQNMMMLLVVALLSYYFFEKPILQLKHRFKKLN